MKKPQRIIVALVAALGSHFTLLAQNAPVVVEAETGVSTTPPTTNATTGDWLAHTIAATGTTPAITYVTSLTDAAAYTAPTSPGGG
jgi:hypothetical protein